MKITMIQFWPNCVPALTAVEESGTRRAPAGGRANYVKNLISQTKFSQLSLVL